MTSIEELLKPVSPDKPCGDDPAYDPDFLQLDILIRGKPETVLSKEGEKAEEPNWNAVEQHCLDIFGRSKHLYLAVVLSLAWLKLHGLPGFRDGTALIRGLLEQYWDLIYPRLDPDDGNDPPSPCAGDTSRPSRRSAAARARGRALQPGRTVARLPSLPWI